ncbi:hypothetical protein ACFWC9_23450 [Streptomyces goshikiensis]|uniref:hypothetical protein n=1 Tax=Streptomyces goshikiensis TaxID=1942 RepID=UPI0036BA7C3E
MSTVVVSRRTLVRAAAVTACAGSLLALPAAAALAEGLPAAAASGAPGVAASQRVLLKSLSLADGVSTAHVYRVAKNAYQADILRYGATVATLTSRDGVPARGEAGELHAALQPDGRLSSWVGETRPAADGSHRIGGGGHKTGVRDGQVVAASVRASERASELGAGAASGPGADGKGGAIAAGRPGATEALRLNSLADGPGDGLLLLAAGGGIAAVGAAGLGFAMLRRGRTNG